MRHGADDRQFGDVLLERQHDWQEGDQRHDRADEARAEILHDLRESHRVFLDALRGALDVAQLLQWAMK